MFRDENCLDGSNRPLANCDFDIGFGRRQEQHSMKHDAVMLRALKNNKRISKGKPAVDGVRTPDLIAMVHLNRYGSTAKLHSTSTDGNHTSASSRREESMERIRQYERQAAGSQRSQSGKKRRHDHHSPDAPAAYQQHA